MSGDKVTVDLGALQSKRQSSFFNGRMLASTPQNLDSRYHHTLIVLYEHNDQGAKGFIVNRTTDRVTYPELAQQLSIDCKDPPTPPIFQAGNQESSRGFVLHSEDRRYRGSQQIGPGLLFTGTIDPLNEIANRAGPQQRLVMLGHTVWAAGALEKEVAEDNWFVMPLDLSLIFLADNLNKWQQAVQKFLPILGHLTQSLGKA